MMKKDEEYNVQFYLFQPSSKDDLNEKGSLPNYRQGRNSHSNVLRYFFKSLESSEMDKPFEMAKSMKNCPSLTKKIFLQWIKDNGITSKNYVRTSTLIKLL